MKNFKKGIMEYYEKFVAKINTVIFALKNFFGDIAKKIDSLYTPEQGHKFKVFFRRSFKLTTWLIFPITLLILAILFLAPLANSQNAEAISNQILITPKEAFIGMGVIWIFIVIFAIGWFWFSKFEKVNKKLDENNVQKNSIEKKELKTKKDEKVTK